MWSETELGKGSDGLVRRFVRSLFASVDRALGGVLGLVPGLLGGMFRLVVGLFGSVLYVVAGVFGRVLGVVAGVFQILLCAGVLGGIGRLAIGEGRGRDKNGGQEEGCGVILCAHRKKMALLWAGWLSLSEHGGLLRWAVGVRCFPPIRPLRRTNGLGTDHRAL